jgi:methionyl aminopeptidase
MLAMEKITLLSKREIEKMRAAGQLAAQLLIHLEQFVQPGISTLELNDEAERWTKAHGAKSAPLGYGAEGDRPPFPKSICTSVNEVVCHGIPDRKQILKEGDILNIDVTLIVDGYHGDTSKMFFVGQPSETAKRLVEVTEKCRMLGIEQVKPGFRNMLNPKDFRWCGTLLGMELATFSIRSHRLPTMENGALGRSCVRAWSLRSSR